MRMINKAPGMNQEVVKSIGKLRLGKRKLLSIPASCHAERSEASRPGPFAGAQGDRVPTTGQLKRSASLTLVGC